MQSYCPIECHWKVTNGEAQLVYAIESTQSPASIPSLQVIGIAENL